MKNLYILFAFSLSLPSINAQTTLIPDTNFEQKLINLGIDTNGLTGDILNVDAESVSTLDVSNSNINDLTGIQAFSSLTNLDCKNNTISKLIVKENSALLTLICSNNSMTQLVFSSNLTQLICPNNNLTSLDLRLNTSLNYLECQGNDLYSLNLKNGANAILGFMVAVGTNTTCINVDNAADATAGTGIYNGLSWVINPAASYSETCDTYVPDDNFEQALIDLGYDTVLDDYVVTANINTVSSLNVTSKSISDLTGIEGFTALTSLLSHTNNLQLLDLSHNQALTSVSSNSNQIENLFVQNSPSLDFLAISSNSLASLNLTQNTLLDRVFCSINQLSTLDVTQNTQLTQLFCNNNSLTSLDVSQNTILSTLMSYNNSQLSSLDVSQNTNLSILNCTNNGLTSLDVSQNVNLSSLRIFTNNLEFIDLKQNTLLTTMHASGNPFLSCIQVANEIDANANTGIYATWSKDVTTNYAEFCPNIYTYVPVDNFEQELINLGYDSGPLNDYVLTANIESVTSLSVNGKSISDLTGIENFVALVFLNCGNNLLTSLDVTQNILLTDLRCPLNLITSIDVSQNTALTSLRVQNNSINILDISANSSLETLSFFNNNITEISVNHLVNLVDLRCYENQLIRLDITQNTALTNLQCFDNNITQLNLTQNVLLTGMDATLNTNLTCIQVADATSANANTGIYLTWLKDIAAMYSENCNYIQETYVPDDNFEQALINLGYDTGPLDNFVPTANINGVFTLNIIGESINDLTGIEGFSSLNTLLCQDNTITTLDVSNNSALSNLYCTNNGMTSLVLSNSINILHCFSNSLSILNVSNLSLTEFKAYSNNLSTLNLSNSPSLTELSIGFNNFVTINVSVNSLLEILSINNNNLTNLDIRYNNALTTINIANNDVMELNLKSKTSLTILNATNNSNLSCVQVDDVAAAVANPSWFIDAGAMYSLDCGNNVTIGIKAFLQGPLVNSGTSIMDDGLRILGNIPNISPYTDAIMCNATVFNITGNNAIIDWVYVELRDKNDNSIIIEGQSALLQADGDIVAKDGISKLIFLANTDNYYISIKHRNHLGIISVSSIGLNATVTNIDLSSNSTLVLGDLNSVVNINGIYCMYTGDFDGNGQIQNTDVSGVVQLLGASGYSNADMDMNGQIQNTDINNFITLNIGKGEQF